MCQFIHTLGLRYFITKFYRMDSLPNFLTHGAPLARFARESFAKKKKQKNKQTKTKKQKQNKSQKKNISKLN